MQARFREQTLLAEAKILSSRDLKEKVLEKLGIAKVYPHLAGGEGKPSWLLLRAEVCGERAMSPTAALRHSARLLLGGLVLSGNHYVLRHTLPLSGLDVLTLEFTLDYVVREAASLRQRILSQTASPPRTALGQSLND